MGHTWKGYIQVNGSEVSFFEEEEFEVTDELYEKIQEAIKAGTPLSECSFYKELIQKTEEQFDLLEHLDLEDEEPDPDWYFDEEEYRKEMEEFKEYIDNIWDNYCIADTHVDDPGDLERFKKKFIGKTYGSLKTGGGGTLSLELHEIDERIVDYSLKVDYDTEGTVTDIRDLDSAGLETESERSSSWGASYPDYRLLASMLESRLQEG